MPSLSQELQELVTSTANFFRRTFYDQEVRLFSYSQLVAYDFSSYGVGTAVWAAGYKYIVQDPGTAAFDYDSAPDGYHVIAADGTKLKYDPEGAAVYPQALGEVPLSPGLGYPVVDQHAGIQKAFDLASLTSYTVDFGAYKWRCESTIVRRGVKIIEGSGCDILFPSSGTYSRWRNDSDVEVGSEYMAMDCSGSSLIFSGHIQFTGVSMSNMRAASRAAIDENMVALGNVKGSVGEIKFSGQFVCQGFRDWMFVPAVSSTGSSRQFARITGQVRVRFCLTPVGTYLGGSNGADDSKVDLRSDRCAGTANVQESKIINTELNFGYFFGTGLTNKTIESDAESSTLTVVNASTFTLSDDSVAQLGVGSIICIDRGWVRATDGAEIPLVTRVVGKVGTTVTIDSILPTNQTPGTSGLEWFWNPPRINVSNGELTANTAYLEGYWDGVKILDNGSVDISTLKCGGTRCSGRYGAPLWSMADDISVKCGVHRTSMLSPLKAIFAFGMIRDTTTQLDHSAMVRLFMRNRDTEAAYVVLPMVGVEPTDYFSTNKVVRFGVAAVTRFNVVVEWTNKSSRYFLGKFGDLTERMFQDGLSMSGDIYLDPAAKFGSQGKSVALNNSAPVSVYDNTQLAPSSGYRIIAVSGDSDDITDALFTTEADGTINVPAATNGSAFCTFSGSGAALQAITDSPSRTVRFSIIGRV